MLKVLFALTVLVVLNQAQAATMRKALKVEVQGAAYVHLSGSETVEVVATYQGGCGEESARIKVRDCAYTGQKTYACVSDLEIMSEVNQSCVDRKVTKIFVLPRKEIKVKNESLMSKKFENSTLIIRGTKNETSIQIRRI